MASEAQKDGVRFDRSIRLPSLTCPVRWRAFTNSLKNLFPIGAAVKNTKNELQLSPSRTAAPAYCAAALALATSANPLADQQLHKLPGVTPEPATTFDQI